MDRCSKERRHLLARALALAGAAGVFLISLPGHAQVVRNFPANALRGEIAFVQAPEIELNGAAARLAPGARVRNADNMLALSGTLQGQRHIVNYTIEASSGLVMNVWILRPEEAQKRPWPVTLEQSQRWAFDPAAQTWTQR